MSKNKRFGYNEQGVWDYEDYSGLSLPIDSFEKISDLMNSQEERIKEIENKLKRIEKEVKDCDIYRDNLKEIVLEIRCILNGDVE